MVDRTVSETRPHAAARTRRLAWTGALLLVLAALVLGFGIALYRGAIGNGFSGADEPAHFLNAYLIWSYLQNGFGQDPLAYARDFYLHYPKISIGHWPPLYYVGLFPVIALAPESPAVAFAANAAVTLVPSLLIAWLLHRAAGWGAAAAGMAWYLLLPVTIEGLSFLMLDQALTALCLLATVAWLGYARRPGWGRALLYGFLAATAIMMKGNGWLLGLLPAFHIALTGRWRLAFDIRTLAGAALALALVAPWYVVTYEISADGFNYEWGLAYTLSALVAFAAMIHDNLGPFGLAAALFGLVSALQRRDGSERWDLAMACLALALAGYVFHALVPVALQPRYMAPVLAALVVLGALGAQALAERLSIRGLAFLVVPLLVLPGGHILATDPGKVDLRMAEAAEKLPTGAGIVVVVDGDSGVEGALATEMAIRDPGLANYMVRSSDLLASSDFMGESYTLKVDTPEAALDALRDVGATAVVASAGEGRPRFPHNDLLRRALDSPASPYRLAWKAPYGNRPGATRLYLLPEPLPVPLERVRQVNFPEKAPG